MTRLNPLPPAVHIQLPRFSPLQKSIPTNRDQAQSRALAWSMAALLVLAALHVEWMTRHAFTRLAWPVLVSFLFASIVWRLRAATPAAAVLGGLICLLLAGMPRRPSLLVSPALLPLVVLFLLTFAATRFKRHAKEVANLAEPRLGRRASQIAANLGVAGLCAAAGFYPGVLAALAEVTADTLSSEIGQALGGPTWLLTTLRRVAPGTDGGLSVRGTVAGLLGAAAITLVGSPWLPSRNAIGLVFCSAIAGLLADSVIGATLERRGWLGNDLVNVTSTLVASLLAFAMQRP